MNEFQRFQPGQSPDSGSGQPILMFRASSARGAAKTPQAAFPLVRRANELFIDTGETSPQPPRSACRRPQQRQRHLLQPTQRSVAVIRRCGGSSHQENRMNRFRQGVGRLRPHRVMAAAAAVAVVTAGVSFASIGSAVAAPHARSPIRRTPGTADSPPVSTSPTPVTRSPAGRWSSTTPATRWAARPGAGR